MFWINLKLPTYNIFFYFYYIRVDRNTCDFTTEITFHSWNTLKPTNVQDIFSISCWSILIKVKAGDASRVNHLFQTSFLSISQDLHIFGALLLNKIVFSLRKSPKTQNIQIQLQYHLYLKIILLLTIFFIHHIS